MKQSVYIETTVVSYLTARPSTDVRRLAMQLSTQEWWDLRRNSFNLFTSGLVLLEASAGDPEAAERRLKILHALTTLPGSVEAESLATDLIQTTAVPIEQLRDATHIAIAACNGIDYLLTWNCTHLANTELRDKIEQCCVQAGHRPPAITTPDQLLAGGRS